MPSLDELFDNTGLKVDGHNLFAKPKDEKEFKRIQKIQNMLKKFVEKEFSSENLNFLLELHELNKNQKNGQEPNVEKIYKKYIILDEKDADNTQINLPSHISEKLKAAKENGLKLDDFSGAANEILNLIKRDTLKRFLVDPEVVSQLKNDAALKQDEAQKPSILKSFANEMYNMLADNIKNIKKSIVELIKRAMDYFQSEESKKDFDKPVEKDQKQELPVKAAEKEIVKKPKLEERVPPPYTPLSKMAREKLVAAKNNMINEQKAVSKAEDPHDKPKNHI